MHAQLLQAAAVSLSHHPNTPTSLVDCLTQSARGDCWPPAAVELIVHAGLFGLTAVWAGSKRRLIIE
jgi:hypothetical protein